ncbi:MAG: RNA polymerase sigma-70 factor [Pseudomonadota bacterium]
MTDNLQLFQTHRPRLFSIAYRMLGIRADAEDVLQDVYLRWQNEDIAGLNSVEAWLVTVTTRLAIDRLRAAKTEREAYVGIWLPEPMVESISETPEASVERSEDIAYALLVVLERLAPEERAAFLLKQVFDHDYLDIARILGKTEAACRQLVHRAKQRVQLEEPRFTITTETHKAQLEKFIEAAQSGKHDRIMAMFSDDAIVMGDGGGKMPSTFQPLHGADRVARLFFALARRHGAYISYRFVRINGEIGLLRYFYGKLESALSFVINENGIAAIYTVRNPDKLKYITQQQSESHQAS